MHPPLPSKYLITTLAVSATHSTGSFKVHKRAVSGEVVGAMKGQGGTWGWDMVKTPFMLAYMPV
eukprot:scaffold40475_cov47-Attheya_sp.AAC.3